VFAWDVDGFFGIVDRWLHLGGCIGIGNEYEFLIC
jgi:hypothetical protein